MFLGSILSVAMLELSIKGSSNLLIEEHTCCTKLSSKVCAEHCLEALVYVSDEANIYKFAHVILVHWHVILIVCKMTCELLGSKKQKNQWTTCEYGAHKCQVKNELYCSQVR